MIQQHPTTLLLPSKTLALSYLPFLEKEGGVSLAIFAIQGKTQQAKYLKSAKMTNGDR